MATTEPKLGLALSGGGHRAAFFHIGVLAKVAELGLLRRIEVISTVSGGSIVGALYYLHVKNLLEDKPDADITDADYVELVRAVEREYREAVATNVRGSAWASPTANFKMAIPGYSRSDRVGELYEERFYSKAWGDRPRRDRRIAMRDLVLVPNGHSGGFDPDVANATRGARVPVLLLEATTLNTGHNWRFEALFVGEPPRQGIPNEAVRADIDKNVILERTRWDDLPEESRDFPLGAAVAASACFPGGFPPIQVPGFAKDYVVELVDGGVHDNQGVEGLLDRGCTHMIISDGSGQMPDRLRPSARLPAVLGRVVAIYGDAEREQRLLGALERPESVAFMHLQTGLPAATRTPAGVVTRQEAQIETTEFGVDLDVQRALANIRTDLDAFCDIEAWSLMADGYQLTDRVVPSRAGIAALGTPGPERDWPFAAVSPRLGGPDDAYLGILRIAKERYLKPARLVAYAFAAVTVGIGLIVAGACAALWFLLVPRAWILYIAVLVTAAALVLYFMSEKPYVKPIAIAVFDVLVPALLAIPMLVAAALQLAVGRVWRRLGSVDRLP